MQAAKRVEIAASAFGLLAMIHPDIFSTEQFEI